MSKANANKQRPTRARFRADAARCALAMDPGGSGLLADVLRGAQPQPGAFGFFDCPPPVAFDAEAIDDGVAILTLSGPLEHHESWIWQSYETLTREVENALTHESVRGLILKIDSPGGVAAGMGEAHKQIRRLAKKHGKPVYAYADQMACSAAYNVAAACDEIWTSEEGVLGSVGVILCTVDETKALEKAGVAVRYVVTGARKADLHPGAKVTPEVLDVAQSKVDYLGGLFFAAVGKARGMSAAAVEALQAAVFHGPEAVKVGLADGVAGWPKFLSYVKQICATSGMTDQSVSGAKAMPKSTLSKIKAVDDAKALVKSAEAAHKAAPTPKTRATLLGALAMAIGAAKSAAKADPALKAKMTKVTEKYSEKHERLEESDDGSEEEEESGPPMSEEEEEAMDSDSDMPSTEKSSAEEEEEEEEEEESGPPASEEEEEEKAIARGWKAAAKAYSKATKGVDAYGVFGPKGVQKALGKATGETSIRGALGALAAMPRKAKVDATVARDVAALKAKATKAEINTIIEGAKAEGRAPTKALRAELREMGAKMGAKYLKGFVATLPKIGRTSADGALKPGADGEGNPLGSPAADAQEAQMIATMTAGMNAKQKADFVARYNETKAKNAATAPRS